MKQLTLFISLLFAHLVLGGVPAAAQDESALKESLMQRVPEIDKLKLSGKVGENNQGILTQRAALKPEETALMNEENKDRRALYAILAKRLNLSMKVVGQGRAEELRKKSAPGVWLQDPDGKWYQQK